MISLLRWRCQFKRRQQTAQALGWAEKISFTNFVSFHMRFNANFFCLTWLHLFITWACKTNIYYNRSINLQLYNCKNSDIGINFWLDKWAVMMGFTLTIKVLQKLSAFAISALIYNSISARTLILASTSALDKWAVMRGLYAHHT